MNAMNWGGTSGRRDVRPREDRVPAGRAHAVGRLRPVPRGERLHGRLDAVRVVPQQGFHDGHRTAAHGILDGLHDVPHDDRVAAGDVQPHDEDAVPADGGHVTASRASSATRTTCSRGSRRRATAATSRNVHDGDDARAAHGVPDRLLEVPHDESRAGRRRRSITRRQSSRSWERTRRSPARSAT